MPRHRKRRPDPVALVVCRDGYHRDGAGYAEHGFHLVGTLVRVPGRGADGRSHLEWTGHAPERGPLRVSGLVVPAEKPSGYPPVKSWVGNGGIHRWRFRCLCGEDRQGPETDVTAFIGAWMREFPGRPCEIPLSGLWRQ